MKYLFVVNPASGKGKAIKRMDELEKRLSTDNIDFDIFYTKPERYAPVVDGLIANNHYTHVIAVGGDGTAHETLNAIIDHDVIFGIIPFGSGNDFARMYSLGTDIEETLSIIKNSNYREIDFGKANDRYFVNYVSFGFDSEINEKASKYKKKFPGGTAYFFGVFHALFRHKNKQITVNGEKQKVYLAAIHNGRYYGGGLKINPSASCEDGLLDSCVITSSSKFKVLTILPMLVFGRHGRFKQVNFNQRENFVIDCEEDIISTIDGEFIDFEFPVNIEVGKKKIKFLVK